MKKLKILVVEDEAVVAFLLGEVLDSLGYEVCAVESNEAEAIASARRCKPDLMIVDEHLGSGSGVNVVRELLLDGPLPHVFVSGAAVNIRKLMPGAVILEKPYFEPELEQAIWNALARPAASRLEPAQPTAEGNPGPALGDCRCA